MNDFFFSSVLIQILLSKLKFSRSSNIKSVLKKKFVNIVLKYIIIVLKMMTVDGMRDSKYGMLFGIY